MTKDQKRALCVVQKLKDLYPDAVCALHYEGDPWRLLVMARLSAQCTDARVNIVSEELFDRYPTPSAMADADLEELENTPASAGKLRTFCWEMFFTNPPSLRIHIASGSAAVWDSIRSL